MYLKFWQKLIRKYHTIQQPGTVKFL